MFKLNHFLPFLRRPNSKESPQTDSLPLRLAKKLLPAAFFSIPESKKPGLVRKVLKRWGPTVHAAPLRRIIQTLCFLLFLFSFFYVCWPYTASPEPPGKVSSSWMLHSADQQSASVTLRGNDRPDWIEQGKKIYVREEGLSDLEKNSAPVVKMQIVSLTDDELVLKTATENEAEGFMLFLLSENAWELHEQNPHEWPSHYADDLQRKEQVSAELFLAIDPLVSLSTGIASRWWVWSLVWAGVLLLICLVIPRGFCGYLCPLGTLIDLFDWSISSRVKRFRVSENGWWVHLKYYLLLSVLVSALLGFLISGFFAAIPVITRGFWMILSPLQIGLQRGWHLVPPVSVGQILSVTLFLAVLFLGFLKPRFWCKYVCPSGALFSLGNLFRISERKVETSCIHCNKCVEICPFDAIKPDFTTRTTDCTLCQTCGGVCPTEAIKFVDRWDFFDLKEKNDPPTNETTLGRRGFLSLAIGLTSSVGSGILFALAGKSHADEFEQHQQEPKTFIPVRPPGSVPEEQFLQMCIRCSECYQACPNNVLQPLQFECGLDGLWTPAMNANWAGCESSCHACGQVCPTGAIRPISLEEKRHARMGLAIVNETTCLPYAGKEACQLCVDECNAAGYHAIEFMQVHTETDAEGKPISGTGYLAPVVREDLCVGCGLCQTRCYVINKKQKGLLERSAIIIEAGGENEDRLLQGSYQRLHQERLQKQESFTKTGEEPFFIPDSPKSSSRTPTEKAPETKIDDDDPFGLNL